MLHLTEKGFKRRGNYVPQVKAYSNAESVELFVNGISCGAVKRSGLDASFSTVFIWEKIEINVDKENEIVVKAALSYGTVLEDKAFWTGIKQSESK